MWLAGNRQIGITVAYTYQSAPLAWGSVLSALRYQLIESSELWGRYKYHAHFTDEVIMQHSNIITHPRLDGK